MKIISWNINGIRAITGQNPSRRLDEVTYNNKLFEYIYTENPDIMLLQEIKAEESQLDEDKRSPAGYFAYYNPARSKKGYSGVAVYTKAKPKTVKSGFGVERFDIEGRFLELDMGDFTILDIYFPNGTSGYDRVEYKLEFYDALFEYVQNLRSKQKRILISGDYNTAHKEIDLARPKENETTSGFLPEERVKIDWMVDNGYVDTFRLFHSEPDNYTWWSQRAGARARNVGWRIDYHFVTDELAGQVASSEIQAGVMGSDHCPIVLELDF